MRSFLVKHGYLILGCLVSVMSALAPPGQAADMQQRPRSPLEGVAALDRPVSYTETKIALSELVQKVAAETGVKLAAAADVADEPVAVVVTELPAVQLLEELAELLEYRWSRRGKTGAWTYEIYQDVASRQQEAALRQAMFAGAEKRLEEEIGHNAEMARRPPAEIEAIEEASWQRQEELNKLPRQQQRAFYNSREGQEWNQRFRAATAVSSPIARVLAGMLGRLSPAQWAVLRQEGQIAFSTDPQSGELPLPAATVQLFRTASTLAPRRRSRVVVIGPQPDPQQEEQMRRDEQDQEAHWKGATGYQVTLRLHTRQFEKYGFLHLEARAAPLATGEPQRRSFFGPGTLSITVGPSDADQQAWNKTPERRAELESDPVFGRKERFQPTARPHKNPNVPSATPWWQIQDLLPDLARTYRVQFISDAYWMSGTISGLQFPAEPTTLLEQLEHAAVGHRWDRRQGLIRLRSRTWFFERPKEVPLRVVRRWRERFEQQPGPLSLAEYVEIATTLKDLQLEQFGDLVQQGVISRGPPDLGQLYGARHALRLYASLPPGQQETLRRVGSLRLTEMMPPQRALFLAARQDWQRRSMEGQGMPPAPADLDGASFSMGTRTYIRTEESFDGGSIVSLSPVPAATDAQRLPRGTQTVTQAEFVFSYGPDVTENISLPVAAASGGKT
jgi:hypothetical protein